MDKISLFVLLAALLYACDGFTDVSGASWLPSFQSAMKRQARDVDEVTQYKSAATFVHPCETAGECLYEGEAMVTLGKIMRDFKISEIYPNADMLCAPKPDCRIDGCNERWINASIEFQDNVFGWVCNNQTGFRDAANCFQPPFSGRASSCEKVFRNRRNGDRRARLTLFQRCVHSKVEGLTACTEEDKTFFLSFFDYILEETIRLHYSE